MALKVGIVGLPNSGKTTIFNCFSETKAEAGVGFANKSNIGTAKVPDERLYKLAEIQPTEKIIQTTIEFVDIPGLRRGSGRSGSSFLNDIRNVDALIHVVRCFDDPNIPHEDGSIDPVRDIETLNIELQQKDLDSIEKRLEKIEKKAKFGDKTLARQVDVLKKAKEHLENFQNLRTLELKDDEKQVLMELFPLTIKPMLYVANVDDASAATGNQYSKQVQQWVKENDPDSKVLVIAAELEAEIAELEDEQDRMEFLKDAGLSEPGINKLIRAAYSLLNLQTFFTVGPKEIRAWTVRKGATAPEAAGVIHTDLQRGFIRAEVMHYNDFIELGSEAACKKAGKFYLEGKDYQVQEGDILHIRFNVSK